MERVFLHLGAHKTATTHVQACLRASASMFSAHDSRLVLKGDMLPEPHASLLAWGRNPQWEDPPPPLVDFLERLKSDRHTSALLSNEDVLGRMSLGLTRTIYPSSANVIPALARLLEGVHVRVGFAVRNYADYLISTHNWLVNSGPYSPRAFEDYLGRVDLQGLSWVPVVKQLREAFGPQNVFVWSYESYRQDARAANVAMIEFFYGDGTGHLLADVDTRVNVSTGRRAMAAQRRLNEMVRRRVQDPETRRCALRWGGRVLRRAFLVIPDSPLQMEAGLRRMLDDRYRAHCRELGIALPPPTPPLETGRPSP